MYWQIWLTTASESLKNVLANLAWVFQNLQAQQNFHCPGLLAMVFHKPWSSSVWYRNIPGLSIFSKIDIDAARQPLLPQNKFLLSTHSTISWSRYLLLFCSPDITILFSNSIMPNILVLSDDITISGSIFLCRISFAIPTLLLRTTRIFKSFTFTLSK